MTTPAAASTAVLDQPTARERPAPASCDAYTGRGAQAPAGTSPAREGFYTHIAEAIAINKQRRPVYARLSGGKSLAVSNLLINLERLTIPIALYFDHRAARFNRAGIPVVAGDFVPMHCARPAEAAPRYTGRADAGTIATVRALVAGYKATVTRAAKAGDFAGAARASHELLQRVQAIEESSRSHFCMVRHIVESTGLAALNAVGYERQSGGKTAALCRDFLKLQVVGIDLAVTLDRKAQELHALGVGILVNDMPAIPFEERWERSPLR